MIRPRVGKRLFLRSGYLPARSGRLALARLCVARYALAMHPTAIISRPFRDDDDFWRIRRLLIDTYPVTGLDWNWDIRRWDGSRFYHRDPSLDPSWQQTIRLWETRDGQLAGAAIPDGAGLFYLQMHPDFRPEIEEDMLAWAEESLAAPVPGSDCRSITTEVYEYDAPRCCLLEKRGYEKRPEGGVVRRLYFGSRPLPSKPMAVGYRLRSIHAADLDDCQRLAVLLNAAFNRTFHNALEFFNFARLAPSYCEDLHLVAEAPDGSFAAHVAVIYDETNRAGLYEPVCTHPAHRRKNLAQSLMFELMARARAMGARSLSVGTGDMIPANALYDSIGFTEVYKSYAWRKII